jgi:hypothetical protein
LCGYISVEATEEAPVSQKNYGFWAMRKAAQMTLMT